MLVHRPKRFIPNLMVNQHKFPEVRTCTVINHDFPAARGFRRWTSSKRFIIFRTTWFNHKYAKHTHDRQLPIIAVGMELASSLLGVGVNIPFHFDHPPLRRNGIWIGGGRRLPGFAHNHIRAIDMQTDFFAKLQRIPKGNLDAIALVSTNDQGLNILALDAILYPTRITVPFFFSGLGIFRFFLTDFFNVFGQGVHITRIVIQPLI